MYSPLDDGQIRLLSISNDTILSFQLVVAELIDPPSYIALSYTWGKASYRKGRPDSQTCPIYIDETELEVDQNLHDALRHLCPRIRERELHLWVDRICINQTDLGERSAQVRLMKQIYEQATTIYGWLGQAFDEQETKLAIELINEFNFRLTDARRKNGDEETYMFAHLPTVDETHDLFPKEKGTNLWIAWDGIAEMMIQIYWSRLWIYQEVTAPEDHNKVIFFCGQHRFNRQKWQAACTFDLLFSELPGFDRRFVDAVGSSATVQRISAAVNVRTAAKNSTLADLVFGMKGAACTDPRDRIYAPLAQAIDVGSEDIPVDYTRSLTDVYVDFAKFLQSSPTLQPLELLGHCYVPAPDAERRVFSQTQEPSLPSWVPDWRDRVLLQRFSDSSRVIIGAATLYDPLPSSKVEVVVEDLALSLKGLLVEDLFIRMLGSIWEHYETDQETPRIWRKEVLDICNSDLNVDQALCRSLVGDCRKNSYSSNGKLVIEWVRGRSFDWNLFGRPRSTLTPEEVNDRTSDDLVLDAMCFGRRLALLSGGRIAILPAAAKMGDKIAVFSGGKALYLLREMSETSDTFSFIGECYVDGLMDGELLNNHKNEAMEMKWLRLV